MSAKRNTMEALNHTQLMRALDTIQTHFNTKNMSKGGLSIGTTSKKAVRLANTTTYAINGVVYQKAAAEVAFTATTMDIEADAATVQEAVYLVSINAAGTLALTKGATATGAGNALIPETPSGSVALGYVRIAVAAGSTDFDASSDDLDAAHITDTYVDVVGNSLPRFDEAWAYGGVKAE